MRVDLGADGVEGVGEHRKGFVELSSHAQALGALAGEHHRQTTLAGPSGEDGGGCLTGCEGAQRPPALGGASGQEYGTFVECGAGRAQRVADVQHRRLIGKVLGQLRGLGAQIGLGARGQHPRHDRRGDHRLGRGISRIRCLFQNHVCVGAAETEGRHGGASWHALRPGHLFGEQRNGTGLPVDLGRGLRYVEGAGQDALVHGLDHFDDACDAGGGLGVAEVGLDGSQPQGCFAVLAVGGQECLCFDGIAEASARAVGLDGVHLVGAQSRVDERVTDHALLGWPVRRGQPVGRAVLVDCAAADDREHRVSVALGIRKALYEQHSGALRPPGPVGGAGKRLTAAIRGEALLPAEVDERGRARHHRRAADQRGRTLRSAQCPAGQVQGDQR